MASTDDLLNDIETAIKDLFELRGYSKEDAKTTSDYVGLKICQRFQGDQIRIRKPPSGKAERDIKIKQMFDGTNLQAVCERFKISRDSVYRIARK